MAKSNSGTASPENSVYGEANGEGSFHNTSSRTNGASQTAELDDLLAQAKNWVEENQATAMLSGFGFGVFIGVLLRR
ncbi:MAG: hypothetical protein AB8G77_13955 [Rhodothermales bacterium]